MASNNAIGVVVAFVTLLVAPGCGIQRDAALKTAAEQGDIAAVRNLLAQGTRPDATLSEYGVTPLFEAASRGHTEVVETLLAAGADPNHMDDMGSAEWARGCCQKSIGCRCEDRSGKDTV